MSRRFIGDTKTSRDKIVCVRWTKIGLRRRLPLARIHALHFTFLNLHHLLAHYQTINEQGHAYEERNHSRNPYVTQNLRGPRCNAAHQSLHEDVEKHRYTNPDGSRDHAGLDFVVALHFRRDTHLPLQLELVHFHGLSLAEHFGQPCITTVKLLRGFRIDQRPPHCFQVGATNLAELHLVALVSTTTRTQHKETPYQRLSRIRSFYDLGSCYPIAELVSFTLQPCKRQR